MRAFIALEVSEPQVIEGLVRAQSELKATGARLKLVERENLHFTMRFLGEISDSDAKKVVDLLGALDLKSSQIDIAGLGAFPDSRHPRVVWAGVAADDSAKVVNIAQPVIDAVKGIGAPDSRPFAPHLTLARVREGGPTKLLTEFLGTNSDRQFGRCTLKSFKLKSSVLGAGGPRYSDIGAFDLA